MAIALLALIVSIAAAVFALRSARAAEKAVKAAEKSAKATEDYAALTGGMHDIERLRTHVDLGPEVLDGQTSHTVTGERPYQERQFKFRLAGEFRVRACVLSVNGGEEDRAVEGPSGPTYAYRIFIENYPSGGSRFASIRLRFWPSNSSPVCPRGEGKDAASAPGRSLAKSHAALNR